MIAWATETFPIRMHYYFPSFWLGIENQKLTAIGTYHNTLVAREEAALPNQLVLAI